MKAIVKLLFAGVVFISGIAQADQLADIKARGRLICGVMSTLPPFGFQDPGTREVVGYDIDFCRGVAKELGVRPELKVIATKSDGPYKKLDDLAGKRVSTIKGSSNIPYVQRVLPTAQLVSYDDAPSAFMALVQNKVDGFVLSETLIRRFIEKLGPNAKEISVLGPAVGGEYWGLGVKKDEPKLLDAINAALDNMEKSGQSQQIFDQWLGDKSSLKMTRAFKTELIPG